MKDNTVAKLIRVLGIIVLLAAFINSLEYALSDYDVRTNILVKAVLDQTNRADY